MEESIDAYLQGSPVVPASDPNRPESETKLQQGEIKDGKKGALQVQPGTAAKPSFNQASSQRWIDGQSAKDLIARCKEARVKTVAGGPLFAAAPDDFPEVDHLVLNEAETTLRPFLEDLARGEARHLYSSKVFPNLETTPAPLWNLIKMKKYFSMNLQYSRGCPFSCEFCDITTLAGEGVNVRVDEKMKDKITQPFFTTKTAGNGLGLATAYRIIRQHRGERTKVESRVGQGIEVNIYLPLTRLEMVNMMSIPAG